MSNADPIKMTVIFEGKVQGVGFRAAARAFAKELNLDASAENLEDGSVKVIIQGNQTQSEALVKKLCNYFHVTKAQIVS